MTTSTHNVALVATSTDNTAEQTKKTTISDEHADRILQAYKMLHGVVAHRGKDTLPAFGDCGEDEWETILTRSFKSLNAYHAEKKEEKVRAFRIACNHVVQTYMVEARKEKEEYDATVAAASPKVRALLAPFPTDLLIPVSEFATHFPQGLTTEQVVHNLSNMSYKVVRGKEKNEFFVKVPFKATNA